MGLVNGLGHGGSSDRARSRRVFLIGYVVACLFNGLGHGGSS